ncbi:MAG: ATP-binding protein [Lachnospiraceae bacterium]
MLAFGSIIGNEHIKNYLLKTLADQQVSHCYILNGEKGMGKKMIATQFAKMLQCTGEGTRPCGKCQSCIQCDSRNHPDVIYVGHEKPNTIGVNDIRQGLVADIQIKPYEGPYKIYIIDEAEKMSIEAQNAMLKTIEEPPSYGIIFLLTANLNALLPTVQSRSIVLSLRPVQEQAVREYLEANGVDENNIPSIVTFARGNIGRAMRMASSESFVSMMGSLTNLLRNVSEMSFEQLLDGIQLLVDYKLNVNDCLDFIQMWYRDVLMLKATQNLNVLLFKDEYRYINQCAKKSSYEGIEKIIEGINVAKRRLEANVNYELTMELLLLTIKENS